MEHTDGSYCPVLGALTQAPAVLAKNSCQIRVLFQNGAVPCHGAQCPAQGLASIAVLAKKWLYALCTDTAVLCKML